MRFNSSHGSITLIQTALIVLIGLVFFMMMSKFSDTATDVEQERYNQMKATPVDLTDPNL